MKSWLAFGLLVVLGAAFLSMAAADEDEDVEQGVHSSIILFKQIDGYMFGVGEEFNVSLVTYNVGSFPLFDLVVDDSEAWGAKDEFQIVDGAPIASFEILPADEKWNYTFTVKPLKPGVIPNTKAKVRYHEKEHDLTREKLSEGDEGVETTRGPMGVAWSNQVIPYNIFDKATFDYLTEPKTWEWALFLAFAACVTIVPAAIYIFVRKQRYNFMAASKKKAN
eukprot:TRINITY_DN1359_c0_g2_i1.p1 TRINITY_DN1359_c0_g2~~TRINITY_DN1359_c0_g2_i1.p1  ORF type:complete len:222 (+),score=60.76 TRINITY_DN1359_c0_g2_i1:229-894(+)